MEHRAPYKYRFYKVYLKLQQRRPLADQWRYKLPDTTLLDVQGVCIKSRSLSSLSFDLLAKIRAPTVRIREKFPRIFAKDERTKKKGDREGEKLNVNERRKLTSLVASRLLYSSLLADTPLDQLRWRSLCADKSINGYIRNASLRSNSPPNIRGTRSSNSRRG